ncbi:MAG: ABC transporter permease, partial [candidate division WOR-3 bacterium]|nr:ABC transporter permease [candidate division WOR-3 bacterium]
AILPLLSTEKGAQASHIFQAVILLISGVYYEVDVLPRWIRPLSVISPATYTLRAIRAALLEGASFKELAPTILLLAGIGIALIPAGFGVFSLAERWAKPCKPVAVSCELCAVSQFQQVAVIRING